MINWFISFVLISLISLVVSHRLFTAATEELIRGRSKLYIVVTLMLGLLVAAGTEWVLNTYPELWLTDGGVFMFLGYLALIAFWLIFRFVRPSH